VEGFYVADLWAALWGAVVVSLTNLIVSVLTRGPPKPPKATTRTDVIDI